MEPLEYLRIFRRRWATIVAAVVIAVVAAGFTTPAHPTNTRPVTSYHATATLLQANNNTGMSLNYVALFVTTGEIPIRAAKDLGYSGDPQLLASGLTVTPDLQVGSLTISASSDDGTKAADTVNAFAQETIAYFRDDAQTTRQTMLEQTRKQLDGLTASVQELTTQMAATPKDPLLQARRDAQVQQYQAVYTQLQQLLTGPVAGTQLALLQKATPLPVLSTGFTPPSTRTARVAIGLVVGLLLGLGLALILDRLDTRLRRRADVQRATGAPVLAEVPRISRYHRRVRAIIAVSDPVSHVADAYRNLRSALLHTPSVPLRGGRHGRGDGSVAGRTPALDDAGSVVVLVTSARAREGKTTSVANVAASLAEAGRRVLVLDCDFRHPDAHNFLDVPESPGLSDLLLSDHTEDFDALVRPTIVEGVRMVTAGLRVDQPTLLPTRMDRVLQRARELADVILIDCAPVLHANDALDLMPFVDSVLLVCKSGRTTSEQAERVAELLTRMQVPVVGAVLVGTRITAPRWGEDSYRYRYRSSATPPSWRRRRRERADVETITPASTGNSEG